MNGVRFKNRRINIWNSATIGIEVADGVKVVDFNDAEPNVELRSVKKQFPSVETLIIGKSTSTLEISNFMFPNVKEVISENNQDFKSGNVLIKHGYDGFKLLNTFCKQADEVIDLQDVISVSNYAFEGCLSKNIINFKLQYAEQYAFHGYPYMSSVEYVNGANCVGDICLSIDEDADVVEIPKNVTMVVISEDFSGSIKIKCNKLIINSAKTLVGTFMVMIFTLNDDDKLVRRLLVSRLCLQVVADWIFISSFKDVGAAYAEIAVNALIGLIAVLSAYDKGYLKFAMPGKDFLKDWCKIGAFAGIQIFLDNFIYAVMVCKMVNAVSESGNYWVANNFIWGWLLVPVACLAEVIKKNDKVRLTMKNCWRYLIMIFAVWLITMPKWKSFISGPMASDGDVIIKIVLPLIPFYITYMISAVIDGWFVSHGRTIYNAINSLIVNVGYYGVIYFMFKRGMFAENMMFIIGMFGCGMLVHMVASILMYRLEVIRIQAMPADCQKKAV